MSHLTSPSRSAVRRRGALVAGTAVLGVLATAAAVPADAAGAKAARRATDVYSQGFVGPLGLALKSDGRAFVADMFAGTLSKVPAGGGDPEVVASGGAIPGVTVARDGAVLYTVSKEPAQGEQPSARDFQVRKLTKSGSELVALPLKHEARTNPDAGNTYGFVGLSQSCLSKVPRFTRPYSGIIESNPYALAKGPRRSVYLADAAANAVLQVFRSGNIRTIAALPPVPVTVDKATAKQMGLPGCTVGKTYRSEPVPTDVEVGPHGHLFVSSLPGAPEAPGSGGVYEIKPGNGKVSLVRRGFTSAVDLAVKGDVIYVAQLFAGQISSTTVDGGRIKAVTAPGEVTPGAVEIGPGGDLYATNLVFDEQGNPTPNGQVVRIVR